MDTLPIISRFAPTPSGYLHRGNALNFILTWVMTRVDKGAVYLRIDDYDLSRCKLVYVEDVFNVLDWLGLDWDEGPFSVDAFYQNFSTKRRLEYFRSQVQALHVEQSLTYACTCSRKEIEAFSSNGIYPLTCYEKSLPFTFGHNALRFHVRPGTLVTIDKQTIALDTALGDFVIWRKDDLPAYQFASLIDDRDMKTSLLVRGEDLLASSAAQYYLATQMGIEHFTSARFYHHPLLKDTSGQKLSKTHQAQRLDLCGSPLSLYQEAAICLGLTEKVTSLKELLVCYKEHRSH